LLPADLGRWPKPTAADLGLLRSVSVRAVYCLYFWVRSLL
jgi:hypothetical protein